MDQTPVSLYRDGDEDLPASRYRPATAVLPQRWCLELVVERAGIAPSARQLKIRARGKTSGPTPETFKEGHLRFMSDAQVGAYVQALQQVPQPRTPAPKSRGGRAAAARGRAVTRVTRQRMTRTAA